MYVCKLPSNSVYLVRHTPKLYSRWTYALEQLCSCGLWSDEAMELCSFVLAAGSYGPGLFSQLLAVVPRKKEQKNKRGQKCTGLRRSCFWVLGCWFWFIYFVSPRLRSPMLRRRRRWRRVSCLCRNSVAPCRAVGLVGLVCVMCHVCVCVLYVMCVSCVMCVCRYLKTRIQEPSKKP